MIQIVLKYIKFEKSLNLHDFLLILPIFEDFRYEFFSMSGKNDVHKFSFSITKRDRVSIYFKLEKLKNQEKKNEYLFIYFTFQVARSKSKTFFLSRYPFIFIPFSRFQKKKSTDLPSRLQKIETKLKIGERYCYTPRVTEFNLWRIVHTSLELLEGRRNVVKGS